MKVEFLSGIASASGTFRKLKNGDRIIVTTRKAPTSSKLRTHMYFRSADSYKRKSPVSENERKARARFATIAEQIKNLSPEQKKDYQQQWRKNKYMFNGKKYATLRGYVMARLYAEQ